MTTATTAAATREAPFADALLELGRRREDVVVLSADLSRYTDVAAFAEEFPNRFFQVGMAEANMMGVAGGLAKGGFLPIAVTYGVFASRRAYDQIAMALATGPSRGIVVAFLPGITTPFRATHQAIDDLAILRALPGIAVLDPGDASELEGATLAAAEYDRTVYIRGQRGIVPVLFERGEFRIGPPRLVRDGAAAGLVSTGVATQWTLEAADVLRARGVEVALLHVPTLKPADEEAIGAFCARFDVVTTVENHSVVGGLAAVVAPLARRVHALGVQDEWAPAGTVGYIRAQLGLDAAGIAAAVEAVL